ncbi:hypothetical protein DPMN_127805 [Dreissena polymorpha]|uniref:Uncharacterized protein n=1 Tax=Dreissena polymorpha TaxID=45954 RepID=A0A9D4JWU4_DREPO|nr:hypothetical protein DPMN_127805 [Dreissena polymorpha]
MKGQLQITNPTQSTCNVWVCTQDSYKCPIPHSLHAMHGFVHRAATDDQSHTVYMQCVGLYTGQLQMTNPTQSTCNVWVCTQDSYK